MARTFELWRQDDNGGCYLVGRYARREAAEAKLGELSRTLHKQYYWIVQRDRAGETGRQG